jgi:hypothetical protein
MDLIARLHAFWTKIGVSPKVADPFVVGLVAVVVTWIMSGSFDLDQVKLLVVTFVYGILGVAAPPVAGQTTKAIAAKPHRRAHR